MKTLHIHCVPISFLRAAAAQKRTHPCVKQIASSVVKEHPTPYQLFVRLCPEALVLSINLNTAWEVSCFLLLASCLLEFSLQTEEREGLWCIESSVQVANPDTGRVLAKVKVKNVARVNREIEAREKSEVVFWLKIHFFLPPFIIGVTPYLVHLFHWKKSNEQFFLGRWSLELNSICQVPVLLTILLFKKINYAWYLYHMNTNRWWPLGKHNNNRRQAFVCHVLVLVIPNIIIIIIIIIYKRVILILFCWLSFNIPDYSHHLKTTTSLQSIYIYICCNSTSTLRINITLFLF